jgi:pyridoxal 5'-phosphate synthase pdxS subunit
MTEQARASETGRETGTFTVKRGLADMLRGGVIMDVVTSDEAKVAEDAGAVAVMALERVPADIRRDGGVARMSDPAMIEGIQAAVTIPVMAKARIGHFAEAQVLQALAVDYIDESEVLTPADEAHHIDKHAFKTPFVCGARNLGEALRRIAEGAAMIRTKGEAGTGDVVHAVRHMRQITSEMRALTVLSEQELYKAAKDHQAPYELIRMVAQTGKLPVPNFSAGGIATPADAALMMQLGAEAIFVGSGIFMKERATPLDVENDPKEREEAVSRARAIVMATTHYNDPKILAEVSEQVTGTMKGLAAAGLEESQLLQTRGW